MRYSEFEDICIEYNKLKQNNSNEEPDFQTLVNSKENFELATRFLDEHCPNTFNIMIANLDSNPTKYETLYDLCKEIDIKKEDNFYFPIKCLVSIKIYYKE